MAKIKCICGNELEIEENWEYPYHDGCVCDKCEATIQYSSTWDPDIYKIDRIIPKKESNHVI